VALRHRVRRQTATAATETTPPLVAPKGEQEVNDTRLIHLINGIDTQLRLAREIEAETDIDSEEEYRLDAAMRALDEARYQVAEAAQGMVCHHDHMCLLPLGHTGDHKKATL